MKNSTLLLLIVILISNIDTKAQTFIHDFGINYLFLSGNGSLIGNYGAEYSPRYNVFEKDAFSVSAGSHIGISLSGSVNSRSGGSLSYFLLLPVLAQVNVGGYSTSEKDGFGGYAELGYALAISNLEGDGGIINGPMFGAGIRFNSRIANEAGFYIIRPIGDSNLRTFGLRFARNIGMIKMSNKKEVEEIIPEKNNLDGFDNWDNSINQNKQDDNDEKDKQDGKDQSKEDIEEDKDNAIEEKKAEEESPVKMTAKEKEKAKKARLKERAKARKQREKEMKARAKARKKRK